MKEGVDVLCEINGLVWLLPGGKDLQSSVTCAKAVKDAGTCEGPVLVALDLGWTTVLEQMATGVWLDKTTAGTGGEPGWLLECTIPLIGKVNDECSTNNGTVILTNNETNGTIEEELPETTESKTEQVNCTLGGNEEGLVIGQFITEALTPTGVKQTLAVSLSAEEPTHIVLKSGVLEFGEVSIEKEKSRTVSELFESTTHPVKYEATVVKNTTRNGFTLGAKNTCKGMFAAGAPCELEVTFTPESKEPIGAEYKATLELEYEDETTKESKLKASFTLDGLSAK
jgi:hypothetical protein